MNKPDDKPDVKTFYSYELDDNKKMIKYIFYLFIAFTVAALISAFFTVQHLGETNTMIIPLLLLIIFGSLAVYIFVEHSKMKKIFDSEPLVAHSWGLETETDGLKANIKWEDMSALNSSTIKFCFFWTLTKYVLSYKGGNFLFYDNIENVNFLENYIRKNMKAVIDSKNEIKWTK